MTRAAQTERSIRYVFHEAVNNGLLLLIAFFLPLGRMVPLLTGLFVINCLLQGGSREKWEQIKSRKMLLLFTMTYLCYLLGTLYSENHTYALADIQLKLSLFIFPVFIGSLGLGNEQLRKIFLAFIAGCFVASVLCLAYACITSHFFYMEFSRFIHPGYFSMYLNTAILLLFHYLFHSEEKRYAGYSKLTIAFFSVIIVLLSSKLGLITLLLLYAGFLLYYLIQRKKYVTGAFGLLLLLLAVFILVKQVPFVADRLKTMKQVGEVSAIDKENTESTAVRLLIWQSSAALIRENFLIGVGTGDVKDKLVERYRQDGLTGAYRHKLNAHNQFIQTFIALGLPGFLILITGILLPLFCFFKMRHGLYSLFLLIVFLNFLTEAMLETQAGVMFYAFFNSLFLLYSLNEAPRSGRG